MRGPVGGRQSERFATPDSRSPDHFKTERGPRGGSRGQWGKGRHAIDWLVSVDCDWRGGIGVAPAVKRAGFLWKYPDAFRLPGFKKGQSAGPVQPKQQRGTSPRSVDDPLGAASSNWRALESSEAVRHGEVHNTDHAGLDPFRAPLVRRQQNADPLGVAPPQRRPNCS
jgi:hypothetical protein